MLIQSRLLLQAESDKMQYSYLEGCKHSSQVNHIQVCQCDCVASVSQDIEDSKMCSKSRDISVLSCCNMPAPVAPEQGTSRSTRATDNWHAKSSLAMHKPIMPVHTHL